MSAAKRILLGLFTLASLLFSAVALAPAAVAGPCITCDNDDPPPPPGPSGPPPEKYQVTVKQITAHDLNDGPWVSQMHDEIYIDMSLKARWGPVSITPLQGIKYPNLTGVYNHYTTYPQSTYALAEIKVMEDDDTSADDHIGTIKAWPNGSWGGVDNVLHLYGSDAHYSVVVNVKRIA